MNYAYVTLLSSVDYLPAAIILDRNLKELNSQYPLCVMVTENIFNEVEAYLKKENISYINVPEIKYAPKTIENMNNKRLETVASKINVFGLECFDKVVYLDIDSFFIKTVDELFDYPDGSLYDDGNPMRGFCGLFVCCPWAHPLEYYIILLQNSTMWESDAIENLWFPFKTNQSYHVPFPYFVNINMQNFDHLYPVKINLYGLHFCGELKPWKFSSADAYRKTFYKDFPYPSELRDNLVQWYYTHYVEPLKNQYPEIFK